MKSEIHRALRGAKSAVHPTPAQRTWLDDARALLALAAELARAGHRIRHARHEAPEAALLDYLVHTIERGLALAARARREGRELQWGYPPGADPADVLPALRLAPAVTPVIPIAPYLAARKEGRHG